MPPHLLLLPSPFLGPAVYEPVVAALSRLGRSASVAASGPDPDPHELIASWGGTAAAHGSVVLVPHSNAGYLAAPVAEAAGRASVIFVDAALPGSGERTRLAPSAFRSFLANLADEDGRLPPWSRWWPRGEVERVLPGGLVEAIEPGLPRVALSYVDAEVQVPSGWTTGPHGYLAFGSTYDEEWRFAQSHGWPRRRLPDAGHLHLLVAPHEVAAAVADLAADLVE